MLKIGLVGGTKVWHARTFSEMFNGYDRKEAVKKNWGPLYEARVEKDARITYVWDVNKEDAEEIARICNIENVVSKKEDMIGKIDGVIIPDDATLKHQRRVVPFLKAGLPTFIDKALSPDIKEAEKIIALAKKYNAPIMSASALRYAKEVEKFKREKNQLGDILTGFAICGGDLVFYGIHAFELLYSVTGPGIKSVRNIGSRDKDMVVVKYKDGRNFILTVYRKTKYLFQMNLYGTKGWREVNVTDSDYYYSHMLKVFVKMVRTKREPFPPGETLEIIKVLVL
ncbi:MAG: Gfo/Idh/MocA family oxidoreductase, partial [Candidatus Omnitrophica bacterium]|nr:Gfo/Idh/MocA family oxidoreductase [Candidatus Omnitrophota bacterium]